MPLAIIAQDMGIVMPPLTDSLFENPASTRTQMDSKMRVRRAGMIALGIIFLVSLMAVGPARTEAKITWDQNGADGLLAGDEPTPDGTSRPLHVCRVIYNGGVHPGKIVNGYCHISGGGKAFAFTEFEVAHEVGGDDHWGPPGQGDPIVVGNEADGRPLYLCRAQYGNLGTHPGKVVNGECYIAYGQDEIALRQFEVFYSGSSLPSAKLSHSTTVWLQCQYSWSTTQFTESGKVFSHTGPSSLFTEYLVFDYVAGTLQIYSLQNRGLYNDNESFSSVSITPSTISWVDLKNIFGPGHMQIDRQTGFLQGTATGTPGTVGSLVHEAETGKCHEIAPQPLAPRAF